MTDYISRETALNACFNGWGLDDDTIKAIQDNIRGIPAAEVRAVGATFDEWDTPSLFKCGVCGYVCTDTLVFDPGEFNFCPNCGGVIRRQRNASP